MNNIFVKSEKDEEEVEKFLNEYAPGVEVGISSNGVIYTDNPLVAIGAIREIASVYAINNDPSGQAKRIKEALADRFSNFTLVYTDNKNKFIFYISNDETFVWKDGKSIINEAHDSVGEYESDLDYEELSEHIGSCAFRNNGVTIFM